MIKKNIYCEECRLKINNKDDLVVATKMFKVVAYHTSCYANKLKSQERIILGHPLNSSIVTLKIIITWIICTILFFVSSAWRYNFLFIFIPIILTVYKIYSWYKFEKYF